MQPKNLLMKATERLSVKLTITYLILVSALLVGMFYILKPAVKSGFTPSIHLLAVSITSPFEDSVLKSLTYGQSFNETILDVEPYIDARLRHLENAKFLNDIKLINKNGEILSISGEKKTIEPNLLRNTTEIYYFESNKGKELSVFRVFVPIVYKEALQGYFEVELDSSFVKAQIDSTSNLVLGSTAIGLILFFVVFLFIFHFMISSKLQIMASVFGSISPDNLTNRIPLNGRDEIGKLSQGFNIMMDALQNAAHFVRDQQEKLENKGRVIDTLVCRIQESTNSLLRAIRNGDTSHLAVPISNKEIDSSVLEIQSYSPGKTEKHVNVLADIAQEIQQILYLLPSAISFRPKSSFQSPLKVGLIGASETADRICSCLDNRVHVVAHSEQWQMIEGCDLILACDSLVSFQQAREFVESSPVNLVIYSENSDPTKIEGFLGVGVKGILDRSFGKDLAFHLLRISDGQVVLGDLALRNLASYLGLRESLTKTERKVFSAMFQSTVSKDISEKLQIAPRTVDTHINNLTQKLKCKGHGARRQLMLRFQ